MPISWADKQKLLRRASLKIVLDFSSPQLIAEIRIPIYSEFIPPYGDQAIRSYAHSGSSYQEARQRL
jgi:hypothetical protein